MPDGGEIPTAPKSLTSRWRTGRRVGRCIHMMVGDEPSEEDILIGVFDTPQISKHIVALHNSALIDGPVSPPDGAQ